jgi:hypothetical protein
MRRLSFILLPFILSALLWWAYEFTRLPPGLEPKGEASDLVPWVSLAGSIVSLATGEITLTLELFKWRRASKSSSTEGDS